MRIRVILTILCTMYTLSAFAVPAKGDVSALFPKMAQDGKWGYIDSSGSFIIRPQFEQALAFSEGVAAVSVCKKFGYINERGAAVIKPQFDEARSFREGLAAVMIIDMDSIMKWGYIDKAGRFIITPCFDRAEDFSDGEACVVHQGRKRRIDPSGRFVD